MYIYIYVYIYIYIYLFIYLYIKKTYLHRSRCVNHDDALESEIAFAAVCILNILVSIDVLICVYAFICMFFFVNKHPI